MMIINKKKNAIINVHNVVGIYIDSIRTSNIEALDVNGRRWYIGTYESDEVCQKAFNMLIEAIEKKEEVFYMPEQLRCFMTKDELILNNINLIYYILKKLNLYDKRDEYFEIGLDRLN